MSEHDTIPQQVIGRAYSRNDERHDNHVPMIPWPLVAHLESAQVCREAIGVIDLRGSRDEEEKRLVREARAALKALEGHLWSRVWDLTS